MRIQTIRRTVTQAILLASAVALIGAAAPGGSGRVGKGDVCNSTCDECYSSGYVGAHLYLAPLMNDVRPPTNDCNQQDSCTYGAGCSYDAARATQEIEVALKDSDWVRIETVAYFNPEVVPDHERDVIDVMTCDGATVLATIPVPPELLAAIDAATPVVAGIDAFTF